MPRRHVIRMALYAPHIARSVHREYGTRGSLRLVRVTWERRDTLPMFNREVIS